jgi:hypothetical protein
MSLIPKDESDTPRKSSSRIGLQKKTKYLAPSEANISVGLGEPEMKRNRRVS